LFVLPSGASLEADSRLNLFLKLVLKSRSCCCRFGTRGCRLLPPTPRRCSDLPWDEWRPRATWERPTLHPTRHSSFGASRGVTLNGPLDTSSCDLNAVAPNQWSLESYRFHPGFRKPAGRLNLEQFRRQQDVQIIFKNMFFGITLSLSLSVVIALLFLFLFLCYHSVWGALSLDG
jgi:hypothetical protein